MTLEELVKQLGSLDEDAILCVRVPWSPSAECVITPSDENLGVPAHVKEGGFAYFLEVHMAHEVLGAFADTPPSDEEKLRLLIHYAENDAYPEWVYER